MSRTLGTFSARLALIRKLPLRLRIAALGEGLSACSPEESEALALELLELAILPAFDSSATSVRAPRLLSFIPRFLSAQRAVLADAALAEISRAWAFIPASVVPAAVAAGKNRWQAVIRQLTIQPSRSARFSLAKLCGDVGDARLAGLTAGMLHDQDDEVAQAAERSLVTLAFSLAARDLVNTTAAPFFSQEEIPGAAMTLGFTGDVDQLLAGAAKAAMDFGEHRRRGAVLAALLAAGRPRIRGTETGARALRAFLCTTESAVQGAIRSVLRWSRVPLLRLRALELLACEGCAGAAAERLGRAQTLLEHELVLSQAHLLLRPIRARAAAQVDAAPRPSAAPRARVRPGEAYDSPLPPASAVHHLSPPARLGVVTFTLALNRTAEQRRLSLEPLLSDPVAAVRHGAMRAIPASGLLDFCFDADERVARSAMLAWSGAATRVLGGPGPLPPQEHRALSVLSRSTDAAVRTWADQDRDSAADPGAGTLAGRVAARKLLAENRPAFIAALRGGLADSTRALATLTLVRRLGLVPELLADVLALAEPGTPARLLATAVAAVAGVDDDAATGAVMDLLSHGNDRVRANAVETVARSRAAQVVELKSDPHHRVRANAIRAQVLTGQTAGAAFDVAEDLTCMLADPRPMHRLAGVWLAARTLPARLRAGDPAPELLARISEAARFDEDPRVRARAVACAQRLAADLRLVWHPRQPPHASQTPAHAA